MTPRYLRDFNAHCFVVDGDCSKLSLHGSDGIFAEDFIEFLTLPVYRLLD